MPTSGLPVCTYCTYHAKCFIFLSVFLFSRTLARSLERVFSSIGPPVLKNGRYNSRAQKHTIVAASSQTEMLVACLVCVCVCVRGGSTTALRTSGPWESLPTSSSWVCHPSKPRVTRLPTAASRGWTFVGQAHWWVSYRCVRCNLASLFP